MEVNFIWRYSKEKSFLQRVTLRRRTLNAKYCPGLYFVNLLYAKYADTPIEGNVPASFRETWSRIVGEKEVLLYEKAEPQTVFFDAFSYVSYYIMQTIALSLKNKMWKGCKKWEGVGNEIFNHEIIDIHEIENINQFIEVYMEMYNGFYVSLLNKNSIDDSSYKGLVVLLNEYINTDDKVNRCIFNKYLQEENGRCIATFVEKNEGRKKYAAFSGFLDTEDDSIRNWLNWKWCGEKRFGCIEQVEFLDAIKQICASAQMQLVQTNRGTSLYCYDFAQSDPRKHIKNDISLDRVILQGLDNGMKRDFSCCERKIFGFFNDDTPDGDLFVKLKLCGRCSLGGAYQIQEGHLIDVHEGLSV